MRRTARPNTAASNRTTRYALMIAAAMQIAASPAFADDITVRDGESITTDKTVLTSLTVESGGSFTSGGQLRLEGDANSRLSSDAVYILGDVLSLNNDATLTLDTPNVFGTSDTPALILSTDDNTDFNDAFTQLIVNEDTLLETDRGYASILAGENADIKIADGATLEIEQGVANIRGTLSGEGTLRFIDSDKNFIENPDGRESTHTGAVIVEESSLSLGTGALANSTTVTFRNNRTDLSTIERTSVADAESLKNGVNLIVENDAFLQLDGKNRPTITHTANELTVSADSEIELTSKAKLRTQEATIAGDISGTGTLIFNGGRSSVIKDSGTTFEGTTQVIDRSTLALETSGALSNSDTLTITGGATVKARATDVFNNDLHLWFQNGENSLDIQGPQTAGHLTLPESSTIAFTSNSSDGNDQLTLTSTTEDSVIRGTVSQEASGKLILDGAKASLYSQTGSGVTVEVKNSGELAIERENAVQGTLDIEEGGIVSVNVENGLKIRETTDTLVLPSNSRLNLNANQAVDQISATQESEIHLADGATLTITNRGQTGSPGTLIFGKVSGAGGLSFSGGTTVLSAAGSPGNSYSGPTTVDNGALLELSDDQATGNSARISIRGGSELQVTDGEEVFDDAATVELQGAGDRLLIETFNQSTQTLDRLEAGADSEVTINAANNGDLNTLVIGANDGDSQIDGQVSGSGIFNIAGSGTTTIGDTGKVETGLTAGDAIALVNNGTITSDEESVAATLDSDDAATADDLTITNTGTIAATGTSTGNNGLFLKDSDRANINNSGTIEANGSTGIHLKLSDSATILNSGDIIAGNNNGIFIEESTNASIDNSGKIEAGDNDGIDLEDSQNAKVVNSGTISAGGSNGILLKNSESARIENTGSIEAGVSSGIQIENSKSAYIFNEGKIEATDNNGIYSVNSSNAEIINDGDIIANKDDGIDIEDSTNAQITNNGSISAGDDNGIKAQRVDGARFINNGTITVQDTDGIDLTDASSSTITNNGTISVAGNTGIRLSGSTDATVVNNGSISTDGRNGIFLKGSTGARIENTGTISANRNAIDGSDPDTVINATITNSGTLTARAETVELNGNHVLRNSGTIEATGDEETAIRAGSNGGTVVILEAGSKVIGDISSGSTDNTLRINVGSSQSVMYETSGDWTLESLDGRPVVEGSVMTTGIGNLETADELMHRRAMDLRDSLARLDRQELTGAGIPVLVDTYTGEEDRSIDANGNDDASTLSDYTLETTGLTLGTQIGWAERPITLFAAYTDDDLDIDNDTHRIKAEGVRIGAASSSLFSLGNIAFGGRVAVGRHDSEGDREVLVNTIGSNGVTRQEADWQSDVWEIAVDARYRRSLDEELTLTFTPELGVQQERVDAYRESADLQWDKREITQGRVSLDAALDYLANERTQLGAALTVWHRDVMDGEEADYTLGGDQVAYTDPVHDDQGISARLGLERKLTQSIALNATAAGHWTAEDTDGWTFGLSVTGRF